MLWQNVPYYFMTCETVLQTGSTRLNTATEETFPQPPTFSFYSAVIVNGPWQELPNMKLSLKYRKQTASSLVGFVTFKCTAIDVKTHFRSHQLCWVSSTQVTDLIHILWRPVSRYIQLAILEKSFFHYVLHVKKIVFFDQLWNLSWSKMVA